MRTILIILIACSILLIASACARSEEAGERGFISSSININVAQAYTDIVNIVIREENLLQPLLPEGVTINWHDLFNSSDIRDSAIAGRLDIFVFAAPVTISAIEQGLPIRILSNQVAAYAAVVSTAPHIRSLSDLTDDSRITISARGSTPHLAFAFYCRDVLGDPLIFDSNLVAVPPPEVLGLMQTSVDYDAYIKAIPALFQIPDHVDYHIIADLTPTALRYQAGTYIATTENFALNNPVLIDAYREACRQAVSLIINDTARVAALISPILGVDVDILVEVIERNPPTLEMRGYDDVAALLYEMGILERPPISFIDLPNYDDIP